MSSTRGSSRWRDPLQQANGGLRERHAERAARQRQQDALREQHAREAAAARAERRAHRQFLLARLGADQEQVRDVAAGDEQHHADGRHQDPQNLARRPRSRRRRAAARSAASPASSNIGGSSAIMRATSALAWASVDARLQPRQGLEVELDVIRVGAIELHRQQECGRLAQELERGRQHADDLGRARRRSRGTAR